VHLTPAKHAMHADNAPSCCRRAILQMFVASGPRVRILNSRARFSETVLVLTRNIGPAKLDSLAELC
jgi:hypothetical protein